MPHEPEPTQAAVHQPVLPDEVVAWLAPREGFWIVDGTLGAGGHASVLAAKLGTTGRVIGLDRDPKMLALAAQATTGLPVERVHASYTQIGEILADRGRAGADGIVLDLGLSSDQIAWSDRGFSFSADGPLDMRYDTTGDDPTAADLVNTLPEAELANLIYEYGEERHSRRIARRIVEHRSREPFATTGQLAEVVRRGVPGKWGSIDPSTRTFQALRIAVNGELERLDAALAALAGWLVPGGRAAIISFHSLEDRRVKWAFRNDPDLNVLTKKPIEASFEEVRHNPRARSAKMRVAERCTKLSPTAEP